MIKQKPALTEHITALFECCYMENFHRTYREIMVEAAFVPSELAHWVSYVAHVAPPSERLLLEQLHKQVMCIPATSKSE
jgi:hypothetical protein